MRGPSRPHPESACGLHVFGIQSACVLDVRKSESRVIGPSSPRSLFWWLGFIAIFGCRGFLFSLALVAASGKAVLELFGYDGKQKEAEQCHQLPQPMPFRFVKGRPS